MSMSLHLDLSLAEQSSRPAKAPVSVSTHALPLGSLAPWRARRVRVHVEENLAWRLDTDVLADVALVSRSHFCRSFKRTFGVTVHQYVIQRRLEHAKRLMLTTSATLTDIAIACGMSDHSHMSRLFRQVIGEPPARWRQRNLTLWSDATLRCAADVGVSVAN